MNLGVMLTILVLLVAAVLLTGRRAYVHAIASDRHDLLVSCSCAYGRLLLETHEHMMTGGLVACDWLRPVTQGGGGSVACGSSNHHRGTHRCKLTRLQWLRGVRVAHRISCHFVVDLGTHTPISLVVRSACVVFMRVVDLSDCSDLLDCIPASGWSDDSVLFYGCECCTGRFSRCPCGEFIKHTRLSCQADIGMRLNLPEKTWPFSLFADMNKRQLDMESLHLDLECKQEFDSEIGGGRTGTCPHCGVHVIANLSRHIMDFMAVPCRVVLSMEGDHPGVYGPPVCPTQRRCVSQTQDTGPVLPSMDGDMRSMERGVASWHVRHRHGRHAIPSARWPVGTTSIIFMRTFSLTCPCWDWILRTYLVSPLRFRRWPG